MEDYIKIKYFKKGFIFKHMYVVVIVDESSYYCYTDSGLKSTLERFGVSDEDIVLYLEEALRQEKSIMFKSGTFFFSEKLKNKER